MKQRVFVTGATGGMGFASLKDMLKDSDRQDIVILARDSEKNRNILKPYTETPGLEIVWGDLNNYDDVLKCVKGCDLILHIAAFVSPAADYYPIRSLRRCGIRCTVPMNSVNIRKRFRKKMCESMR